MPKTKPAPAATLAPPFDVLSLESIAVQNADDLTAALQWIRYLRTRLQEVQLQYDQALAELNARFEPLRQFTTDDQQLPLSEALAMFEGAVADFARDHQQQLLPAGRRSYESPAGKIALAQQPLKIELTKKKETEAQAVDRILEELDVLPEIDRIRLEYPDFEQYVRLEFKLNRSGLLDAIKTKRLSVADLRAKGLKTVRGPEKVTISF